MDSTDTRFAGTTAPEAEATVDLLPVALDFTRLPGLTRGVARMQRLVVDERLDALVTHQFGLVNWRAGTRNLIDVSHAATLQLRWGAQTATLLIDLSQLTDLASVVRADQSGTVDPQVEAMLRAKIGGFMLDPLRHALAHLGMPGVEVAGLDLSAEFAAGLPADAECCAVSFHLNEVRYDAVFAHIDDGWLDALEELVTQHRMPFATRVSEVTVPGRLLLGEKSITLTTLDSLRPGDIILRALPAALKAFFLNQTASVRLPAVWGHPGTRQLRAFADLADHTLTLTENPTMSHDMSFSTPLADSRDQPVEIEHLDLPLKLEIDTVSLPVAQLSALRAGYVLELPTALPDARIRLVTYGQTIGFGELVTVGDHLGVRLVQMSSGHGSV